MENNIDLPYHFPDHLQEAARRAQEFQRLSPDERWREITVLMELGLKMAKSPPRHESVEQRMAEQEAEWQRIQQELFAHYGVEIKRTFAIAYRRHVDDFNCSSAAPPH